MTASAVHHPGWRSFGWSAAYLVTTRLSAVAAVPMVLHSLGGDLYAAWVVAGSLIMLQGLVDFGVGAALIRFVAVAAAEDSRRTALLVVRRSAAVYCVLAALVGIPMFVFAHELARLLPYLGGSEVDDAATILRYVAGAFAISNLALVLASVLQGAGRIATSYRAQTLGWLLYVPALAGGLVLGESVHAVGLAWVIAYAAQVILLVVPCVLTVRGLGDRDGNPPGWRELVSLGARWQVSSWADFATFQLPRLVGGVALGSGGVLALDLAMRGAQLVVAPLFAFYPMVLPAAASEWTRGGKEGLKRLVQRWAAPGLVAVALGTALALPLLPAALAAWTGRSVSTFDLSVTAPVLLGFVAHAATGIFTSIALAMGTVGSVVVYKARQLVLAAVLLPLGAVVSTSATALALGVALGVPAIAFLHASRQSGVWLAPVSASLSGTLAAACVLVAGAGLATSEVLRGLPAGVHAGLLSSMLIALTAPVAYWLWFAVRSDGVEDVAKPIA